ncbi:hypothetical protein Bpfe_029888 [Biomphalaria pfeifferi]|uniref:Uncharacterized protein n=1 Tax=Biomphalaria pfeifferi TaxID=112525 RepID=A0AAD8EUS2_BIOPF|nr:hypothetical protein Bpfe_029888 [Biomphalaria pfeifferi]
MDLEVSRKLIPHHLLVFEGNAALKSYYRKVVESYDNKLQSQLFNCQICYSDLILHHTRLQSGHRPTKKMNKLLIQMKTKYLKKKQITLVTRYLNSPNYLTVRCHACGSINKFPLTTTEAKMKFKKELLKSILMTKCLDVPKVKKKRKKGKKKEKKIDLNCGLHLPSDPAVQNAPMTNTQNVQPKKLAENTQSKVPVHKPTSSGSTSVGSNRSNIRPDSSRDKLVKQQKHKKLLHYLSQTKTEKHNVSLSDFLSSL